MLCIRMDDGVLCKIGQRLQMDCDRSGTFAARDQGCLYASASSVFSFSGADSLHWRLLFSCESCESLLRLARSCEAGRRRVSLMQIGSPPSTGAGE